MKKEKLDKQYDPFAGKYTNLHIDENHFSTSMFFRFIKLYIPPQAFRANHNLLDLGCGAGVDFKFYKELGYTCGGVDSSSEMRKIARKNFPDIDVRNGKFANLPYQEECVHVVVSKWALQTDRRMDPIYQEVKRVLVPRGLFAFLVVHPIRHFLEKKKKKKDYFTQEIVTSRIFSKKIVVYEPSHTLEEYLSSYFLRHFDLLALREGAEFPAAEQIGGDIYPTYLIVVARKK